jgi:hypothetical protein
MSHKNTIKIKKYSDHIEEFVANAPILPGMLVELMSTGKVRKAAAESSTHNVIPMFALEDELQGKGVEDLYATGDPVQVWIPYRGDFVLALLETTHAVVIGDFLVSHGDGRLRKLIGADESIEGPPMKVVAIAMEAMDRSGASDEETQELGHIVVMVV